MKKRTISFLVFLTILVIILGLNYIYTPFQRFEEQMQGENMMDGSSLSENFNADEILAKMDDKDRVGQLLSVSVYLDESGAVQEDAKQIADQTADVKAGFFTIFGSKISVSSAISAIEELEQANQAKITPWFGVDHEGGDVQRLSGQGFTVLDSWYRLCNTAYSEAEVELRRSAVELSNVGIDIVFAPVIDVGPVRPPMGERLCSSNPNHIAQWATLYMNTFKTQGIMPVLKHFPGIGSVEVDLHKSFSKTFVGLEDVYLYNNLLQYFPDVGVMTAHVGVINQHSDIPCSLSKDCVGELTGKFPTVLVVADSLEMGSVNAIGSTSASRSAQVVGEESDKSQALANVAKQAILAGNDVLLFGPRTSGEDLLSLSRKLIVEYHEDENFKARVDESARKIIGYKLLKQETN